MAVILDEIRTLPVEPLGLPLPADPRLQRIARALIADPADARDLDAWARWAAVSSRTLSRRFVSETGFSFTDRKSTRLNSSHQIISYAVFCLKKKKSRACSVRIQRSDGANLLGAPGELR